jgi:hypothetical protein
MNSEGQEVGHVLISWPEERSELEQQRESEKGRETRRTI